MGPATPGGEALCAGAAYAACGTLVGWWIGRRAVSKDWRAFFLFSGTGVFLSASSQWLSLIAREESPSVWRGAWVGACIVLVGHLFAFYLMLLSVHAMSWIAGSRSSTGERPVGLLRAPFAAVALSLWSYVLVGWFTVPVGAAVGAVLIVVFRM